MEIVIVIFLILFIVQGVPYVKTPIPNQNLQKFEDFELAIPEDLFGNTDDSRNLISITSNKWIKSSYESSEVVGSFPYINVFSVFVVDDFCFLTGSQNFYILDISNPERPKVEGYIEGGIFHTSLFIYQEAYAFAFNSIGSKVDIIDISNKSEPFIMGTYECSGVKDIVVYDEILYISGTGLFMLDVSVKSNPVLLSSYSFPNYGTEGIFVSGNVTFLSNRLDGLKIMNTSSKTSPSLLGSCDTLPGSTVDVFVEGSYAYIAQSDPSKSFAVIDISVLTNPTVVGSCSISAANNPSKLVVKDSYAYIAELSTAGGFIVVDISTKTNPFVTGSMKNPNVKYNPMWPGEIGALDVFVKGDLGFVGFNDYGLAIVNITNNSNPELIWNGFKGYYPEAIDVCGKYLFVGDSENSGLKIISIENKTSPFLVSTIQTYSTKCVKVVEGNENILFIGDAMSLKIYDISQIDSPQLIGNFPISDGARDLFIDNDEHIAYITDGAFDFKIVDISNLTNPRLISSFPSTGIFGGVIVSEDLAYLTDFSSLQILNVSNKSNPYVVGTCKDLDSSKSIQKIGNIVVVTLGSRGIRLVDISDHSNPIIVGKFGTYGARNVFVSEGQAYISDDYEGIQVVNIADPTNPVLIGEWDEGQIRNLVVEDNYMYVLDTVFGIKIVKNTLKIVSSSDFSSFCGSTEISLLSRDGNFILNKNSSSVETSFTLFREGFCNGHGICLLNYKCSCSENYEGDNCETWSCHSIDFKESNKVCSGHGTCSSPNLCRCQTTYYGTQCSKNILYAALLAPSLSIIGVSISGLLIFLVCCVICICIVGILVFFLSIIICSCIVIKQTLGLRKFGQLKDFDLLLKEQKLDEDQSVAHLRINKGLFEIEYGELELIKILGEGGSNSVVYKAKWKGQSVAFKCFKTRSLCNSQDSFDEFEREVQILGSVSHPNILRFIGCCLDPPRVGIVMEFCKKGDLSYFFRLKREQNTSNSLHSYPLQEKLRMCLEISSATEYLHSRNIIHRDMKLENVLVNENDYTKLMDFGASRLIDSSSMLKTQRIGTCIYMAPEMVSSATYDEKCDVFSFALMLFIIISENIHPYGIDAFNIEILVANNPNKRPKRSEMIEKLPLDQIWIADVVVKCWDHDPSNRLSFSEITKIFTEKKKEFKTSSSLFAEKEKEENKIEIDSVNNNNKQFEELKSLLSEMRLENERFRKDVLSKNGLISRLEKENKDMFNKIKRMKKNEIKNLSSENKKTGKLPPPSIPSKKGRKFGKKKKSRGKAPPPPPPRRDYSKQ